jgi:hypothetical protein
MKRIVTILRAFLISPELFVSVLGVILLIVCPHWFAFLSGRIGSQAELLKYLGLLPAALVAFDLRFGKSVVLPDADKQTMLQNWPRYAELRCSVMIGVLYGFIFAVAGIAALLFDWRSPAAYQSAVLVTSLAGALTVSATLFYAHVKIEELFRENGQSRQE